MKQKIHYNSAEIVSYWGKKYSKIMKYNKSYSRKIFCKIKKIDLPLFKN